jgi:hypothetical protein
MTDKRQFTLRVQPDVFLKMKHIAEEENRSVSMAIEFLMKQKIKEYESLNGLIDAAALLDE